MINTSSYATEEINVLIFDLPATETPLHQQRHTAWDHGSRKASAAAYSQLITIYAHYVTARRSKAVGFGDTTLVTVAGYGAVAVGGYCYQPSAS